jgi:hypothetical protein
MRVRIIWVKIDGLLKLRFSVAELPLVAPKIEGYRSMRISSVNGAQSNLVPFTIN